MANLEERDPRPLFLIIGMINTKDPVGYFKAFKGLAEQVFTVPIRGSDAGIDRGRTGRRRGRRRLRGDAVSTVADALAAITEMFSRRVRHRRGS